MTILFPVVTDNEAGEALSLSAYHAMPLMDNKLHRQWYRFAPTANIKQKILLEDLRSPFKAGTILLQPATPVDFLIVGCSRYFTEGVLDEIYQTMEFMTLKTPLVLIADLLDSVGGGNTLGDFLKEKMTYKTYADIHDYAKSQHKKGS